MIPENEHDFLNESISSAMESSAKMSLHFNSRKYAQEEVKRLTKPDSVEESLAKNYISKLEKKRTQINKAPKLFVPQKEEIRVLTNSKSDNSEMSRKSDGSLRKKVESSIGIGYKAREGQRKINQHKSSEVDLLSSEFEGDETKSRVVHLNPDQHDDDIKRMLIDSQMVDFDENKNRNSRHQSSKYPGDSGSTNNLENDEVDVADKNSFPSNDLAKNIGASVRSHANETNTAEISRENQDIVYNLENPPLDFSQQVFETFRNLERRRSSAHLSLGDFRESNDHGEKSPNFRVRIQEN